MIRSIRHVVTAIGLAATVLGLPTPSLADATLPAVFGSHMVLQRDVPIPVWGWADPGEEVTVTLGEASAKATADAAGNWKVTLPALALRHDPRTLSVAAKNKITLDDILVGEVWLGSGQSNMEWGLAASANARETIGSANHPQLRLLHVPKVQAKEPAQDVKAAWKVCTPESVPAFSAALYHFGTRLQEELKVPVGLIAAAWGGSQIEPWTIHDGRSGGMVVTTDLVDNLKDIHPRNKRDVGHRLARWALAKTYGRGDVVYSGPLYKAQVVEGDKLRLSFAHAAGLAARDGQPLTEFEVAGEDGRFVPALATIDGDTVVVSATGVTEPREARFGWRSTAQPNLVNAAGLPASPFRTQEWKGATGE